VIGAEPGIAQGTGRQGRCLGFQPMERRCHARLWAAIIGQQKAAASVETAARFVRLGLA
jgi:hypothetical protein